MGMRGELRPETGHEQEPDDEDQQQNAGRAESPNPARRYPLIPGHGTEYIAGRKKGPVAQGADGPIKGLCQERILLIGGNEKRLLVVPRTFARAARSISPGKRTHWAHAVRCGWLGGRPLLTERSHRNERTDERGRNHYNLKQILGTH